MCELIALGEPPDFLCDWAEMAFIFDSWTQAPSFFTLRDESMELSLLWCIFLIASQYQSKSLLADLHRAERMLAHTFPKTDVNNARKLLTISGHTHEEVIFLSNIALQHYRISEHVYFDTRWLTPPSRLASSTLARVNELHKCLAWVSLTDEGDWNFKIRGEKNKIASDSQQRRDEFIETGVADLLCLHMAHVLDHTPMSDLWRMRFSLRILSWCADSNNRQCQTWLKSVSGNTWLQQLIAFDPICCHHWCELLVLMRIPIPEHTQEIVHRHTINYKMKPVAMLKLALSILSKEPRSDRAAISDVAMVYLSRIHVFYHASLNLRGLATSVSASDLLQYCDSLFVMHPGYKAKLSIAFTASVAAGKASSSSSSSSAKKEAASAQQDAAKRTHRWITCDNKVCDTCHVSFPNHTR